MATVPQPVSIAGDFGAAQDTPLQSRILGKYTRLGFSMVCQVGSAERTCWFRKSFTLFWIPKCQVTIATRTTKCGESSCFTVICGLRTQLPTSPQSFFGYNSTHEQNRPNRRTKNGFNHENNGDETSVQSGRICCFSNPHIQRDVPPNSFSNHSTSTQTPENPRKTMNLPLKSTKNHELSHKIHEKTYKFI